ncbi:bromodomain-containing protein 4 [Bactrocera neohumeralis]|uniref:bromodomain-containing protein 4 n=1 Tax=Bactrocera neohumeralis TaxID=98809 RepID=UPI002165F0E2|nr:bromodomain-containing protein 4 [Bactrocera neohumeralis]
MCNYSRSTCFQRVNIKSKCSLVNCNHNRIGNLAARFAKTAPQQTHTNTHALIDARTDSPTHFTPNKQRRGNNNKKQRKNENTVSNLSTHIWNSTQRFLTLTLVACATLGAVSADVSHLAKHYIPPRMMMPPVVGGSAAHMSPSNGMRLTHRGEHTVTTIEKQELRELPTQTEYLRPGQMPYGIGGNMENHHGPSDMRAAEHSVEKPLAMMMPRELLPPPPPPPAPTATEPIKQEQMATVAPSKQYLAPVMSEMNEGQMRQHNGDMPSKQYLAPAMMEVQQQRQVSATNMPSRQYLAPMVKDQKQEQTEQQPQQQQPQPQQHQQAQQQQQPTPAAPSRQYLTPMLMQMRDQMHEMPAMNAPSRQYLAPAPAMPASNEQHLQQQSAPAPQYLPPQQPMHEMPVNQYSAPHSSDSHAMTMQQLMEQQNQMAPQATQSPATHYLPPAMQMQRELAAPPMPVAPPMQPSREYLSPFGEAENVAEAAQEVAEMFDDQSAQQPMPPPAAEGEEEPANYYLPPQSVDAQSINYQHYGAPSQSEPLAPVDFVRQHQQLMTQYNGVPDAPVSFAQFQSINSAEPTLQTVAEPTPAHYLADDGYHYRDGGNSNVLSNGNDDARRFRVRH